MLLYENVHYVIFIKSYKSVKFIKIVSNSQRGSVTNMSVIFIINKINWPAGLKVVGLDAVDPSRFFDKFLRRTVLADNVMTVLVQLWFHSLSNILQYSGNVHNQYCKKVPRRYHLRFAPMLQLTLE